MKFCFYVNLIVGILLITFQLFLDYTFKDGPFSEGAPLHFLGELSIMAVFGMTGILLLIAASNLKRRMDADKKNNMENTFLIHTE